MAKITEMQDKYCHEYLVDFHQQHAAIRAGCSPISAASVSSKWMKLAKIKARIAQIRAEIGKTNGATLERTVDNLAQMANADPADMFTVDGFLKPIKDMPPGIRKMIAGMEFEPSEEIDPETGEKKIISVLTKVKLVPKEKVHDMLMKHQGGYEKDNDQKRPNFLVIDIVDDDELDQLEADGDDD